MNTNVDIDLILVYKPYFIMHLSSRSKFGILSGSGIVRRPSLLLPARKRNELQNIVSFNPFKCSYSEGHCHLLRLGG